MSLTVYTLSNNYDNITISCEHNNMSRYRLEYVEESKQTSIGGT